MAEYKTHCLHVAIWAAHAGKSHHPEPNPDHTLQLHKSSLAQAVSDAPEHIDTDPAKHSPHLCEWLHVSARTCHISGRCLVCSDMHRFCLKFGDRMIDDDAQDGQPVDSQAANNRLVFGGRMIEDGAQDEQPVDPQPASKRPVNSQPASKRRCTFSIAPPAATTPRAKKSASKRCVVTGEDFDDMLHGHCDEVLKPAPKPKRRCIRNAPYVQQCTDDDKTDTDFDSDEAISVASDNGHEYDEDYEDVSTPVPRKSKRAPAKTPNHATAQGPLGEVMDLQAVRIDDAEMAAADMAAEHKAQAEDDAIMRPMKVNMMDNPSLEFQIELATSRITQALRRYPTKPSDETSPDDGRAWSFHHCAFKSCTYSTDDESARNKHVVHDHRGDFEHARECFAHDSANYFADEVAEQEGVTDWRLSDLDLYHAAICQRECEKACTAGQCFDRRHSDQYVLRHSSENICAPICCVCARVCVKDRMDLPHDSDVEWVQAMQPGGQFLGMKIDTAVALLGLETYHNEYGVRDNVDRDFVDKEFADWQVRVQCGDRVEHFLCCPEDRQCEQCMATCDGDLKDTPLCESCMLPVCQECRLQLSMNKRPRLSLANDLWFGYMPSMIYEKNVTYMELLCASVCSPCMLSVQLEKYGFDLRKEHVHQQEHRVGARGNMVAFMFPLEDFLSEMTKLHKNPAEVQLPLVGEDLQRVVQVVLMAQQEATKDGLPKDDLRRFLTTATVRSDIVLELIEEARRRGNPLYTKLNMDQVRERAKSLPHEAAVPPEVLVMLKKKLNIEKRRGGKAPPTLILIASLYLYLTHTHCRRLSHLAR